MSTNHPRDSSSGPFAICAGLTLPLLFMLRDAVRILQAEQTPFHYDPQKIPYFEITLTVLCFAFSSYIIVDFDQFIFRAGFPNVRDLVIGNFAILLVLEGTRRSIGLPLAILGLLALANCYLGPYLLYIPGLDFFAHRGYSASRIIDQMYLGTEGIYGIPLGVVATFVFHFVLFGIFTMKTGLGQLFIDMAMAHRRLVRGGAGQSFDSGFRHDGDHLGLFGGQHGYDRCLHHSDDEKTRL